ncbi:HAMP domain-containing histidine kinase [Mucilaginibacter achroorhodeus]|uniref:histidine kinase n=1 Tax=Mucilaginibacter achroorhodeus TaxID=2599294 RepID=A0A563U4H2_9SPHI|nr:HAMP domain-containing sensor histidine kinase [Mucilaginibacter achroorhodeus]TWR26254.1 HAMP domain-containing histidine kinase [Mucilaginibacter achroorhodeus]
MRNYLILSCIILGALLSAETGFAQNRDVEIVRKQLLGAKDSAKYLDTYNQLGFLLHLNSADSTFIYGVKGLAMASRQHNDKAIAQSYSNIAAGLLLKGLYSQALSSYAASYGVSAKLKDTANMMQSLMNQALAYDFLGDSTKRVEFSRRSLALAASIPRDSVTSMTYVNYAAMNPGLSADSISLLLNKAVGVAKIFHDERVFLAIDQQNADRFLNLNQPQKAGPIIDRILITAKRKGWDYHYLEGLGLKARYYTSKGDIDSAINIYFKIADLARKNGVSFWETEVQRELIKAYDSKKDIAKSLYYHRLLVKALEEKANANEKFVGDYLKYAAAQTDIQTLEAINAAKNKRIIWLTGIIVIGLILLIIVIWQFKRSKAYSVRLAADSEFKGRLISVLAHDFRSPLSTTLGLVELLRDDTLDSGTRQQLYDELERDTRQVLLTFDNLLVWVKEQSAGYRFKAVEVNLKEIWLSAEQFFSRAILANDLKIIINIDPAVNLLTDIEILQFVNRNLLHNAIKHSPAGGNITVDMFDEGKFVRIAVTDQGPGMDEARVKKLFAFGRPDNGNPKGGAGMAMTIARDLIEKLGGSIWVESKPGNGTSFYYRLKK